MKIALFSPYLPKHTGGGEKYLLDVAETLSQKHQVSIGLSDWQGLSAASVTKKYQDFFSIDLSKVSFVSTPLGTTAPVWEKWRWTARWDMLYYLTDGSFFFSGAKRNIVHIQIPFTNSLSLANQFKLATWPVKNANSAFTQQVVQKSWQVKIPFIHYPMVETPAKFSLTRKKPVILGVGRFIDHLNAKRQDVLVKAFSQLLPQLPKKSDWRLVLIGAVESQATLQKVQRLAQGLPVTIITDASRRTLEQWYAKASLFWHAAGFGVDDQLHPEQTEHFGITPIEAMGYGAVPLLFRAGGLPEVLGPLTPQLSWTTQQELVELSLGLIKNPKVCQVVAQEAYQQVQTFGRPRFAKTLSEMIGAEV